MNQTWFRQSVSQGLPASLLQVKGTAESQIVSVPGNGREDMRQGLVTDGRRNLILKDRAACSVMDVFHPSYTAPNLP